MDSIVTSVIEKFKQRAEFGQKKYGTNLDRKDLSFLQWVNHAQEELMDGILYLEKMKQLNASPDAQLPQVPSASSTQVHR
jgi:hypothetical protein